VAFHSIIDKVDTSTATGKLVFHMLCAVNQFVPDITSEKTEAALRRKKKKWQKTGGKAPFGYDYKSEGKQKILVENSVEQIVIQYMRKLREEGYTLQAICQHLEEKGYKTKQGKNGSEYSGRWYPKNVRAILCYKTPEMVLEK